MEGKNTSFASNGKRILSCAGKEFSLEQPLIMGILNLTPDSFFDGGKYQRERDLLNRVNILLDEGADIIDMGGMSTRPGAQMISGQEELSRLLQPLRTIKRHFPGAVISVDTFRSEVAKACVGEGADMINDISGGTMDDLMFETIVSLNVPYVLMHIQGTPQTMQQKPIEKDVVDSVKSFFVKRVALLKQMGFDNIILDPGFGFGKSLDCNYRLLKELERLRVDDLPILVGISRKSMINRVLNTLPQQALNGTTVLNVLAIEQGADLLRVHDVKEAKETIKLYDMFKKSSC